MKNTYQYFIEDHGETLEDAISFVSEWDEKFPSAVAEEAAKYHWSYGGGWENNWPLKFHLYTMNDKDMGIFLVELDYDLIFYAEKVE